MSLTTRFRGNYFKFINWLFEKNKNKTFKFLYIKKILQLE